MNGDGSTLNGYLDAIGKIGGTTTGILGALRNKPAPAAAPAAAPKSATPWGMIAAIGGGVLLLLIVLMGSRK